MLNDTSPITEKPKHEWAADLNNLGAEVASCLEQMLDGNNTEKVNDIVRKSSLISRILENFRSEQRDMLE